MSSEKKQIHSNHPINEKGNENKEFVEKEKNSKNSKNSKNKKGSTLVGSEDSSKEEDTVRKDKKNINENSSRQNERINEIDNSINEKLSNKETINENARRYIQDEEKKKKKDIPRDSKEEYGKRKMKEMIELRNMNLLNENKLEKLNTISNMDGRKKMFKLVLENVDVSPEEVMKHVLDLLKKKTKLNTKIKINNTLYKMKYKELTPDDKILFLDQVKNIINCKYIYIGVLVVSKCFEENKFDEKNFQKWQMEDSF